MLNTILLRIFKNDIMRSLEYIRQIYKQTLLTRRNYPLLKTTSFCILCGDKSDKQNSAKQGFLLCLPCQNDLPTIKNPCAICGGSLASKSNISTCGKCLKTKPFYQKSIIPLEYDFPVTTIIKRLKFNDKLLFSGMLANILLDKISERSDPYPETIIPVPLHPFRLIKRGFNQSELIAKELANSLKIPVDIKSCRRIKNTSHQTGFSHKERKKNIRNAFDVKSSFSAKHVAILDDVVTTGSTVNELARVLQQAGAEIIEVWACARTDLK